MTLPPTKQASISYFVKFSTNLSTISNILLLESNVCTSGKEILSLIYQHFPINVGLAQAKEGNVARSGRLTHDLKLLRYLGACQPVLA